MLYLTHKTGKKVVVVSLQSGEIAAQHPVGHTPESIAVTPDGRWMYVALLTREHDPGWRDEDGHEGYIAEFDLEAGVKTREFHITEDPFDLVATDGGFLVVSSGSGQWTRVRSFKIENGQDVGNCRISQKSHLALHPSQTAVYAGENGVSPADLDRLTLDPVTGVITWGWSAPYHAGQPMGGYVHIHPNGSYLITRHGGIFTCSEVHSQDMRYISELSGGAAAVVFDPNAARFLRISREDGGVVIAHDDATYAELERFTLPQGADAEFLGISGPYVYAVSRTGPHTRIDNVLIVREDHGPAFIRGDPNSSGATDIADAVSILRYSFAGDPGTMRCEDAGDASDDGAIDIQDAILLLNHLFKGGPPPSPTLKSGSGGMLRAGCGTDPTSDGLGCKLHDACTP